MSSVYVVQRTMIRSKQTGELVNMMNFSPAERFGQLKFVLPPDVEDKPVTNALAILRKCLGEFTKNDYLLPVGKPLFICWAAALATTAANGHLKTLVWDHLYGIYDVVETDVFEHERETDGLL